MSGHICGKKSGTAELQALCLLGDKALFIYREHVFDFCFLCCQDPGPSGGENAACCSHCGAGEVCRFRAGARRKSIQSKGDAWI